jgi:hypothetical protein
MVIARATDLYRVFVSFERFASRLALTQPDNQSGSQLFHSFCAVNGVSSVSQTNSEKIWFKKAILAYYKVPKTARMATMSSHSSPTSSTDNAALPRWRCCPPSSAATSRPCWGCQSRNRGGQRIGMMPKQLQDKVSTQPPPLIDRLGRKREAENGSLQLVRRQIRKLQPPF